MLSNLNDIQKKSLILELKGNIKKNELSKLKNRINELGGMEYTYKKIEKYSELAIGELGDFPESEYKNSLLSAVTFNRNRNR